MAATYNLLSSSTTVVDRSKVRLYARDTNVDRAVFDDIEWDTFIAASPSGNLRLAAAWGLRSLAVDTARLGKWKDAGVASDAAAEEARLLAEWLEGQAQSVDGEGGTAISVAAFAGGISIADKDAREDDSDRVEPFARSELHDHPDIIFREKYDYRGA